MCSIPVDSGSRLHCFRLKIKIPLSCRQCRSVSHLCSLLSRGNAGFIVIDCRSKRHVLNRYWLYCARQRVYVSLQLCFVCGSRLRCCRLGSLRFRHRWRVRRVLAAPARLRRRVPVALSGVHSCGLGCRKHLVWEYGHCGVVRCKLTAQWLRSFQRCQSEEVICSITVN